MTDGVNIRVEGVDKLLGKFAKIDAELYGRLVDATKKSAISIHKRAATYPRQRPSAQYRRTGTLGRRWKYQVYTPKRGPWARVSNRTHYGKWVMGEKTQARIHKGRWARIDQIAKEQERKVNRFYEAAVEKSID